MIPFYALVSILAVSSVAFIGITTFALKETFVKKILIYFVAFSSGALIGDTFLHLLPEASETNGFNTFVAGSIFAGILSFFVLEKFLLWHHCHEIGCHDHSRHLGIMSLVSDSIHNFIDGALIGVSFLVSIPLGLATTLAVIFHEIPDELGNFAILLHSGFSKKGAIFYNFISGLTAVLGGIVALYLGARAASFQSFMLPFTAGTFLYIAMTDLIPELHKELKWQKNLIQLVFLALGIAVMYSLLLLEN